MTNPADNPCTCRACGTMIPNEVTDMCEDCVAETNRYYDERDASEREDYIRDMEMTIDNEIRENCR